MVRPNSAGVFVSLALSLGLSFSAMVLGFAVVSLPTDSVSAQTESARELFARAIAARQADDMLLAEELLARSLELDPRSATAYNLAEVRTRLGRSCGAVTLYRALEDGRYGELDEAQEAEVGAQGDAVEARLSTAEVVVRGAATARLRVDAGAARTVQENRAVSVCLDEGDHVFSATSEGYTAAEQRLLVDPGSELRVELQLGELPVADSGGAAAWLWISLGTLLAAGAVVGIVLAVNAAGDSVSDPVFGNKETLSGAFSWELP